MNDSLHLVGDGDDLDVIADVERTFGISIADSDAEATLTVGQLHDLIEAKCGGRTELCLSQLAFHRLRRALRSLGVNTPITPATPIVMCHRGGSIVPAWKALQKRSGLRLPPLETPFRIRPWSLRPRWLAIVAFAAIFAVSFWLGNRVLGLSPLMMYLLIIIGLPAMSVAAGYGLHLAFRNVPRRIATVGELAREAAGYTFVELARSGRAGSPGDRWFALLAIVREISGYKPAITRDTTFLAR